MGNNEKNSIQRLKILYLYKIMLEQTDENHHITMNEIINQLALYGISAARKALYEDIEALRTFGLDIKQLKGNTSGYFVASREFELPELKLLADAVTSSRFLTEKKSNELLKKIEGLASKHEAKQIQRQVFVANRVKAMNERIYINVDTIQRAISEGKKISVKYFDYGLDKKKKYRDYPKYAFSSRNTLRSKLTEDKEDEFILRQLDGEKSDIGFLDTKSIVYRLIAPYIIFIIVIAITWCLRKIPFIRKIVP